MSIIPLARLVAFGLVSLFSLVIFALSAHIHAFTHKIFFGVGYFTFAALSLATAILSLLTLPAMVVIDNKRKGAVSSMIVTELSWLGLLWVLWLAAGGLGAEATGVVWPSGCGYKDSGVDTLCREFPAVTALSFFCWIILFAYTMTILVLTLMAGSRGHSLWYTPVSKADFFAPAAPAPETAPAPQLIPVIINPQNSGMAGTPMIVHPQYSGVPGTPVMYSPNGSAPLSPMQLPGQLPGQVPVANQGWAGQPVNTGTPVQPSYPQV